jgi:hypothetical protein
MPPWRHTTPVAVVPVDLGSCNRNLSSLTDSCPTADLSTSSSSSLLSKLADFLEGEPLSGKDLISVASEASDMSSASLLYKKVILL